MSDHSNLDTPAGSASPDQDPALGDLVARYLDRLNDGHCLEAREILEEEPEYGPAILEELETFMDLGSRSGSDPESVFEPVGTLGDYSLRRQIGRGGMGVVYEAWQGSMDRRVALKILPGAVAADDRAFNRFMREARAAGKLNHPSVVAVHAMGQDEHTPYYAMEFVDGETLARILARIKETDADSETPFGPKEQVDYFARLARAFAGVADGLQHAHSKGVVHRDIKPSNLILDGEDRLRILDFGLARLEGQESLTISGDVVGTPHYMSPEQALRRKVAIDHRTDVYSLGATLYEALTFEPPIRGRDHADTLSRIIERAPVDPTKLNSRVPADLGTIVLKCLRKDRADRYGTAEALAQDLRRFVRGDPIEARPQPAWERFAARLRRHRTKLAVAATILALVGVVGWMAYRGEQAEERIQAVTEEAQRARLEAQQDEYRIAVDEVLKRIYAGQYSLQVVEGELEGLFFRFSGRSLARMAPEEIKALWNARESHPVEEAARELAEIAGDIAKPDAHYHLARAYVLLDREDDAKAELRKALNHDPDFVPAKVLLSEIEEQAPGFAAIWAEHQSADDWRRAWLDAHDSVRQSDWPRAADAYERIIKLRERGAEPYIGAAVEAHIGRGMALLKMEGYFRAKGDFWAASALVPGFALGALLNGKAHYLSGEKIEAEELLGEVYMRARPEERDEAALWIAGVYHAVKDYERGLYWANQLGDDIPLKDRLRCYFLLRSGDAERAAASGRRAIRRNDEDAVAHLVLSSALRADMGRRRGFDRQLALLELLGVCARAVELNPANVAVRDLLVTVRAEAGFQISRFIRRMTMRHPRSWGLVLTAMAAFGISDGGAAQECGIDWLTYLGNRASSEIETRDDGTIVVALTSSLDHVFPEEDDFLIFGEPGGIDIAVLLLAPDAREVLSATWLGGPGDEGVVRGMDVADDGSVLVAGHTSGGFPVTSGAFQTEYGGGVRDGFVVQLDVDADDPDDRLLYSTFVGGSGDDVAFGAHQEADGSIVVASYTNTRDLETTDDALYPEYVGGSFDLYLLRLDPVADRESERLLYGSYFGGRGAEPSAFIFAGQLLGNGSALDASGKLVLTGHTVSNDFPTTTGARINNPQIFVSVLARDGDGFGLEFSTAFGGGEFEIPMSVATRADGSILVTGATHSWDFPTRGPVASFHRGSGDIFVTLVDPGRDAGEELVFSSFYGGSGYEEAKDITPLADGLVVFAACDWTAPAGLGPALGCGDDVPRGAGGFLGLLDLAPESPRFGELLFGRPVGGSGCMNSVAALPGNRGAVFLGSTRSGDLPRTEGALLPEPLTFPDAFLGKMELRVPRAVIEPTLNETTGEIRLSAEASETPDGTEITEYTWSIGTRPLAEQDPVVTTILEPGRRTITLNVTNSVGHRDTAEIRIDVPKPPAFVRGDCNGDGGVDVADATCALNWLFSGAADPGCVAALNSNGDAEVNLTDPVSLLQYLFAVGPAPTAPFPECAAAASEEDRSLGCKNPPNC